jgi:hypothetical protein
MFLNRLDTVYQDKVMTDDQRRKMLLGKKNQGPSKQELERQE